ncbi:MAG TPA: THUMP domain-containing protein [Burkholderiales bacterium]|nr:THUMP domain-containing protein [Burkholderiales bacterium]
MVNGSGGSPPLLLFPIPHFPLLETFFSPCPRGLEAVLADELGPLGAQRIEPLPGGVQFHGDLAVAYRVNLESRIASRVLWQIAAGEYRSEDDLYQAAFALDWPQWFPVERTLRVNVAAIKSPLRSLDFVTLRIKDAVCDRFREHTGRRPSVDTRAPDVRIHAFLDAQRYTLYLDTSGEPLFKRALRASRTEAPLRDNLAAGILRLAGWQPGTPFLDPMCGSGTFLLEAARIALDAAPGAARSFAFERLAGFDARAWHDLKAAAKARQKPIGPLPIYGSDLSGTALAQARANLAEAGLDAAVQLKQANVLEIGAPADSGVLVTNPPYGVRIGDEAELAEFYPKLGDVLKRTFAGWNCYFFTADLRLPKLIRLTVSKRTPLFNGALECRLFEFRMVAGSMRRTKGTAGDG